MTHGTKLPYRADVDGLRSVAVLSVVLYHVAGYPSGGFVGVDIFFVISGFLITGIIARELARDAFSYTTFYERRARRILPALFAMLAASTVVAVAALMPEDLSDFGAGLMGAGAFSSNVVFWFKTDYFAGSAELNALLHTWSLAVEEQFYLFFPLVLTLVGKLTRRRASALLAVALLSLAGATAWLTYDASGAFYLIPSRTWELMVGSILALAPGPSSSTRTSRELASFAGAVLLAGSFVALTPESVFPGISALPACLGTALLIRAGAQGPSLLRDLLSTRAPVLVGQISYSLYLWHWPILVFTRYLLLREPTALERGAVLAASFAAAWVSWRFVETPFRHTRARASVVLAVAGAGSVVTALTGLGLWAAHGLPQRFPDFRPPERTEQAMADHCLLDRHETWKDWGGEASCSLVSGEGPRVVLWGDSHANHLRKGLQAVDGLGATVILYASSGCAPILGMDEPTRPSCRANNDHVLDLIEELHIDRVVLASSWSYAFERHLAGVDDVAATVRTLRDRGVDVRVIGQVPVYDLENPQLLAYRLHQRGIRDYRIQSDDDRHLDEQLAAAMPGVPVFDPRTVWCTDQGCTVVRDGEPMIVDHAHLSAEGSRALVSAARAWFEDPVSPSSPTPP